jgi:hypothetical protein
MYPSIEDSEVVFGFERNNAGLKNLTQVLSEQTSESSAFLNAVCLLKVRMYSTENSIFHI